VNWLYRKRVDKIVIQMIDALNLMSNGLKSGLSVAQALGLVVQEMPNPIQQEFQYILNQNKLGVSLEEAFNGFAKRVQSDDVEMFVTSVNILKETGGNLAETFDTIVSTIRERIRVEKKIASMVAQGFYQGILVMGVPPVMGVTLYQSDPETMTPMFTTPLGWVMILAVLGLEVAGFFVIMRIVKIDV
jgi:tight adherence protein B